MNNSLQWLQNCHATGEISSSEAILR